MRRSLRWTRVYHEVDGIEELAFVNTKSPRTLILRILAKSASVLVTALPL